MAFGNVIPIDDEIARRLARRQIRFRWLVAGLTAGWAALLVPIIILSPLPPLAPFVALAVLVVLAEHRFVLFGDETSMSASIIVIVASVFVFADTSPFAGPMLVASLGGLYVPHLRQRNWSKASFNGAAMGIAALSAALMAATTEAAEPSTSGSLVVAVAAISAYWIVNNLIVAGHQAVAGAQAYRSASRLLISSDTEILVWTAVATLGVALLRASLSATIAFLAVIVCIRIACLAQLATGRRGQVRVNAPADPLIIWLAACGLAIAGGRVTPAVVGAGLSIALLLPRHPGHPNHLIAVGLPLMALTTVCAGLLAYSGIGAITIFMLHRTWRSPTCWTACVAAGAMALPLANRALAQASNHDVTLLCVASLAVPIAAATGIYAFRSFVASTHRDAWASLGLLIPHRSELVALAGAVAAMALLHYKPALVLGATTAAVAGCCISGLRVPRSRVAASR